jgi:hypothetical protein
MILALLVPLTAETHLPAPPSVGTGAGRQEDRREVIFLFGVERLLNKRPRFLWVTERPQT